MARTNNLTNFLTDVATAIKNKKGSQTAIPAANFDTEIANLPSQGTYQHKSVTINSNTVTTVTPDAQYDAIDELTITTQIPEKQLQSKSYTFTQNTNITLSPESGYDGFSEVGLSILVPGSINNQNKTVSPTTSQQSITADSGYTGLGTVTVNAVTSSIDNNITAGNIKKNVTILGVTGNYEGSGGGGDVKLFDTIADMQADVSKSEGDLAVVYQNEISPITEYSEFDKCIFPNEVILPTPFSDMIYGMFGNTGEEYFEGMIRMDSSEFSFQGYGDTVTVEVNYISYDGMVYHRTDGGEELQEFGTTIQWVLMEPWNNVLSSFMFTGNIDFQGLYECKYVEQNNSQVLQYVIAETQLDVTQPYVYQKTFYGNGGVQTGTLTNSISSSFTDVNAEVYSKVQAYYNSLTPRILTDNDKTIDKNIRAIPCKSNGTPLYDTSNVTNMQNLFYECSLLQVIPLLDTSSVTNMKGVFTFCSALTAIPLLDTSSATDTSFMFDMCSSLTTIPLLDISNAIDTKQMFQGCSSLTTVPQLDTGNSTNMTDMFGNCSSLTTVPQLDTSSCTNMSFMFEYCPSLSNTSLNNILAMCANSAVSSNKTLKRIGLTSAQATTCQSLSNYSAFTAAGWTTGY